MAYTTAPVTGKTGVLAMVVPDAAASASAIPAKQFVIVKSKAASSSIFGDFEKGWLYYNTTAAAINPVAGDSYYLIGPPDGANNTRVKYACFTTSFGYDFSSTSQDFTRLCNNQAVSIAGQTEVTGTIEGFLDYPNGSTLDVPDDEMDFSLVLQRFIEQGKVDSAGKATRQRQDTTPIAFLGWTVSNRAPKSVPGKYSELIYAPSLNITSLSGYGVSTGDDNQTFTINVEPGPNEDHLGVMVYRFYDA